MVVKVSCARNYVVKLATLTNSLRKTLTSILVKVVLIFNLERRVKFLEPSLLLPKLARPFFQVTQPKFWMSFLFLLSFCCFLVQPETLLFSSAT